MISAKITYQVTTELGVVGKPLDIITDANGMIEIKSIYSYSPQEFDNIVRQLNTVVEMMNR